MLKPLSVKEILAELLKLNQYDDLEERRLSRSFKGQAEQLERNLQSWKQLHQREGDRPSTSRPRNSAEPAPTRASI